MKKLTEQEFAERVLESKKDIELVPETFEGTKKFAEFRCLKCNNKFSIIARNILKDDAQCPNCKKDTRSDKFSEYIREKSNGEFEVIEYAGYGKRSLIKHNVCGKTFDADTKTFRENLNCPVCGYNHKLSQEEVLERIKEIWNEDYEILSEYISMTKPIKVKHKTCGHIWSPKAQNFLNGHGCPKCANNQKKETEDIKNKVTELTDGEYEFIGEYKNIHEKALFVHRNCPSNNNEDYEFITEPNGFINAGQRCPKCAGTLQLTHEEFLERIKEQVGDEYTVLGEYVNMHTKIRMKHNECGTEYDVRPYLFVGVGQRRCPVCNESKGEHDIRKALTELNVNFKSQYIFNDCKYKRALPFDFAVFDNNDKLLFLIEYDGEQHYEPVEIFGGNSALNNLQERDKIKTDFCNANNIKLVRIPYWNKSKILQIIKNALK